MPDGAPLIPAARGAAFDPLADEPRWVAWRNEERAGRLAKVPYSPAGGRAKADDPATWGSRAAAAAAARTLVTGHGGGVGIELGALGADTWFAGVDLDSCVDPEGGLAPWVAAILAAVPSYAEVSPSGTGVKAFFYLAPEDMRPFLDRLGAGPDQWGVKRTVEATGQDHPPAVEVYLSGRHFAVTGRLWPGQPDRIAFLEGDHLAELAAAIPGIVAPAGPSETVGAALAVQEFSGAMYRHGINPSGALQVEGRMSQETIVRLAQQFRDQFAGSHNAAKAPALG